MYSTDDVRRAVSEVLTGQPGLDTADVWSLTERIVGALGPESSAYEYAVALYGEMDDILYESTDPSYASAKVDPVYGDVLVRRPLNNNPWEPVIS